LSFTKYDVATQASFELGGQAVQSFTDDGTREAEVFGNIYATVLDDLLSTAFWSFATRTFELSRLADAPANPNFAYQYQLPSDHVSTREAMDEGGTPVAYIIEGERVLANASRLLLRYVFRPDESTMPPWFVRLLVLKLAHAAAEPLAGMGSVKDRLAQELAQKLDQARITEARGEPNRSAIAPSRITQARAAGSVGW
jgi:hypothetical protein